ncbi:MAG: AAA family ATPase [Propionibacteriales bacterium]|nr:AAA family ATPase [Propionibacteriales bacterium]
MRFHADLHIHSKYSRACSKDCDLEHLTWWARRKGVSLVGTGDFTHPAWFDHLRESLVPAEPGLYRLRDDLDRDLTRTLPPNLATDPVQFMLSVEISTIYKRNDRTRKVHHLVYVPDFDAAAEFNRRLGRIGNLGSDGRPILGLDSRDLLEITLECGDGAYLVPAHVWTPWFAVLGSKSGFDAIQDCYVDLADHIFALETGLSSDPAMNWRVSGLDRYRLVSNSDAHSPPMLGREATVFDTDLDYASIRRALETGDGHAGSVEFFPEEGKYHVDGHRKCGVRMEPPDTREHAGICPECGKPLTVGVLSRVEELADRRDPVRPDGAAGFRCLIPLPEVVSEIVGTGPKSKKVLKEIDRLTATLGPELSILENVSVDDIEACTPLLGEAIGRLRRDEVIREAGYDGEYGVIRLFEPGELRRLNAVAAHALFDDAPFATGDSTPSKEKPAVVGRPAPEPERRTEADIQPQAMVPAGGLVDGLDPDQRTAAEITDGPLLIVAGPGTGKTRTLTHRLAHLVTAHGVPPEHCLAITFTRRAAEEMAERLAVLVPEHAPGMTVATLHSLGVRILREQSERAGLSRQFGIADRSEQMAVAVETAGDERAATRLLAGLARRRSTDDGPEFVEGADRYAKALRERDLVDFDDLIAVPAELLENDPDLAAVYRDRYRWISVDEYQDIDEQQYRLLRGLAPPDGNLAAIGDPDQSIYRFRGADVGFFLRFQQDFPGARTVQLTRNFRSNPYILAGALQVIEPTTLVPDRQLRPMGVHRAIPVGLHHAASEPAEAEFVARTIEQVLGGASFHALDSGRVVSDGTQGLGFSDFAVLYRTDRQARAVMEALTRAGLPFQKRSHDRLADRPGVPRLLAELAYAPTDAGPPVTEETPVVERLRRAASFVLDRLPDTDPDPPTAEIDTALDLLRPLAERCADDLERFRTELSLGVEVDTWDPRADRVSLLTLHAAKGLEFPVVFVVGCEDGLLPLRWSGTPPDADDEEQVREERRLLFVGMTRARQHLYLSHAAERLRQGTVQKAGRSPFLSDLDPAVCERIGDPVPRTRPRTTQLRLL